MHAPSATAAVFGERGAELFEAEVYATIIRYAEDDTSD